MTLVISNLTNDFIHFIENIRQQPIDKKTYLIAKTRLIDYLGVAISGYHHKDNNILSLISEEDLVENGFIIFGKNYSVSQENSALINAYNAHLLELDDGHRVAMVHSGAVIFSVVLPFALRYDVSLKKLLQAVIIGYEAAIRIAELIQPAHKLKGYHASATCGVIGASIALSVLENSSVKLMKDSMGISLLMTQGLLVAIDDDSNFKPMNIANAARNAMLANHLSKIGFKGPDDILGNPRGIINLYSTIQNKKELVFDFIDFSINQTYVKPHAACRHAHPAIDALKKILSKEEIISDDVHSIIIYTYELAIKGHDSKIINSSSAAKMSIPYSIAAFVVFGHLNQEVYEETSYRNSRIISIMDKIELVSDDVLTKKVPKERGARLIIKLMSGESHTSEISLPKGEPENPLSESEILDKFRKLTSGKIKSKTDFIDYFLTEEEKEDQFLDNLRDIYYYDKGE